MTRLKSNDIKNISRQLDTYDDELLQKTGQPLRGIACHALDLPEKALQSVIDSVSLGIVPIGSGQGVLEGFCDTVKHIVQHIGFNAFVTRETDAAGIAEAVERNAEVIMMADDLRFVALNIKHGRIVDNADATGKGFAAGLDLMVGGLKDQKVLVIGCGPVGRSAALAAIERGARVSVFDIDNQRSEHLAQEIIELTNRFITVEPSPDRALCSHQLLVDATNSAGIIDKENITPQTYIAAPGMPLGLTPAAVKKIADRLLHDPLQLGVAIMTIDAAISTEKK
jgi:pyrrolysine biosynthesis protein PylD